MYNVDIPLHQSRTEEAVDIQIKKRAVDVLRKYEQIFF